MLRRTLVIVVAVVVLLPIAVLAALSLAVRSEWGERQFEKVVGGMLDRKVEANGISVRWGLPPGLVFAHLRISNPEWAETPDLVNADGVYARFRLAPLFLGKVVIPYLGARHATAGLEVDGERATWKFGAPKPKDQEQPSHLYLMRVYLDDGHIRFIDKAMGSDLAVDAKGSAGEGGMLQASAKGTFHGQPLTANAKLPGLETQHEGPLRFEGQARVARTEAAVEGTMATDGSALDMQLRLAGPTMKELSKISGIVLPDSPPYRVGGHLRHNGTAWTLEPFEGKVGDSDVAGSFTYDKRAKKPLIQANLRAKLLDFDDLGPLIGAPPKTGPGETAAPEQKQQAAQREATDKLLPDKPFETGSWGKMDADVKLTADKIQRPKQLPLEAFSTHLVLKDAVLKLDPLNFGMAGGNITAAVTLDGNQKPMKGTIKADVKGLHMAKLFPTSGTMQEALGVLYGRTELSGSGQSIAALLGSSDGKASFVVEGGRVANLFMELAELDVAHVVMLLGGKHEQEALRCAVAGFDVKGGQAQADTFVVDAEDTSINVEGGIDLKDETLDLKMSPAGKHQSLVSLRTPIHLEGPLRHPKARPEAGPLVKKGALAVGLGAINPALAVFALYEPARGKDQPCAQLIADAKAKGAGKAKNAPETRKAERNQGKETEKVSGNAQGAPNEAVATKK
jgi:uncharacterized protein involved in outer membrane biogenesis